MIRKIVVSIWVRQPDGKSMLPQPRTRTRIENATSHIASIFVPIPIPISSTAHTFVGDSVRTPDATGPTVIDLDFAFGVPSC